MRASQTITITPEVSQLAAQVAGNLMKTYDTNSSTALENNEVAAAQIDAYKALGRVFVPTQFDIAGYGAVLDANTDGKVTQEDLQRVAERYIGLWTSIHGTVRTETVKRSAKRAEEELKRSELRKQLSFIRKIFEKYDSDKSGSIGAHEVRLLLEDTYKIMGINRSFTDDDVLSFMKMMNKDLNGQVTYPEYEECIINSLMKKGINIE
jgi:hypothetical protein